MAYRQDDSSPVLTAFRNVVREVALQRRLQPLWASARSRGRPPGRLHVVQARENPRVR
jgi:hypothetical protein